MRGWTARGCAVLAAVWAGAAVWASAAGGSTEWGFADRSVYAAETDRSASCLIAAADGDTDVPVGKSAGEGMSLLVQYDRKNGLKPCGDAGRGSSGGAEVRVNAETNGREDSGICRDDGEARRKAADSAAAQADAEAGGRENTDVCQGEEESGREDAAAWQETVAEAEQILGGMDFSSWQQAADEAGLGIGVTEMIRALLSGELAPSLDAMKALAYELAMGEARGMAGQLIFLVGPSLLWALNRSLSGSGQTGGAAGFLCFLAGAGMMLGAFSGWMEEARAAVTRLNSLTGRIFPALMALAGSAGSPGMAGVLETLAAFLSGGLTHLAGRVMTVLGGGAAVLAVAGNMTGRVPLHGLQKLCCSAGNWLLGGMMTVFLSVASLGGVLGSVRDGVTLRAAKYAADNLLPVVGGDIADAMGAMASSALLVKNAAGVTGMLLVAAACLRPVLRLAMGVLVCRLAAALTEPVADGPLRRCAAQMGQAVQLLLVAVAVCAAMFMSLIGAVLSAGRAVLG